MRNIKTIFTYVVVGALITALFISCKNDDKTGSENNTPETDTEIKGDSGSGDGETENTETIESKDFPADLLGQYRDDKVYNLYSQNERKDTLFYKITDGGGTEVIIIKGTWLKDSTTGGPVGDFRIEKWTKTTKGGKTIKLEGKDSSGKEATVTYDYASGTLSGTYTDGSGTYLFNGKRIGKVPF